MVHAHYASWKRLVFLDRLKLVEMDGLNIRPPALHAQSYAISVLDMFHSCSRDKVPVVIVDEAQNLPHEFFRDLPSFLNFVFESKDYMTLWLVGHAELARELNKPCFAALSSRIQVRCELKPVIERDAFKALIQHGFNQAGATATAQLLSELTLQNRPILNLTNNSARIYDFTRKREN